MNWDSFNIIDDLRQLAARGYSASYIAGQMASKLNERVTRNMVIGKCHRDGIQLRRLNTGPVTPTFAIHRPSKPKVSVPKPTPIIPQPAPSAPSSAPSSAPIKPPPVRSGYRLIDIPVNGCHYEVSGQSAIKDFRFCGQPVAGPRKHYCAMHHKIMKRAAT